MTTTRRLTGFKPTGHLHLGNLLGALRPLIAAQDSTDSIALIADLHALTIEHDPDRVRALTLEQATVMLAAGVDPERTPIVVQSQVPEHTELHYLLECATGFGEAARMIQFKEKSAGGGHVRLSLLTYPVLMAADILLHDIRQVPVGEDQNQHLELARTIATRFNGRYGETFTVPEGVRPEAAARVMDLAEPTAKMGKSSGNGQIGLLDPPDVVRRIIARAVTDELAVVRRDREAQPGVTNLIDILAECAGREPSDPHRYGVLKREVTDAVEALLAPIRVRHAELAADPAHVRKVLAEGAAKVRARAQATVRRTRAAIGLLD
ncbi:tryptophan--tRNA ligase 1 [Actinoplanes italicus]|uniref:Tryptophan--tRNA ligase n=1 Tax=Actinoplanes italicus TaxID=113567 RepID=A0A2T0KIE8_9ACTN|nr:tryptophan--tRNA ligase [Actinoplanes italicus]PRX23284.1 tryptophanyl-tRNA synthetase [Actinoplanes italicus]GIE29786.1 tryptophan--tRNA ligase 1 [Actinoplanes italicus]